MAKDYDESNAWDDAVGGGLLDTYVGKVDSSEFGIDEEYRDDTIRGMWDIELVEQDDPDIELEPGDVVSEAYNVGNDSTWEVVDGGRSVGRVDGKRAKYNNSSGFGRLIAAATKGAHFGDDDRTRMEGADKLLEVLRERGTPFDGSIWEGLTFRFERLNFSFYNKQEKQEVEYQRVYPVEFLGVAGESKGKASKGKTSKKGSGKKAATEAAEEEDTGPSRADLLALAAEHETHSKFLAAAMKNYPGVEDGEYAAEIIDKDGLYAEAHA